MAIKSRRKRWFYRLVDKGNLDAAAAIHVTADQEATSIKRLGLRPRLFYARNGANLPPENLLRVRCEGASGSDRTLRVLYIGRIHLCKGLDDLLRAWAIFAKRFQGEAVLEIVGPEDSKGLKASLLRLAADIGIAESVVFGPAVYGDDKWRRYLASDVVVLPSKAENFGLTVAEAMACEVPVITSTGTPWKEVQDVDAGRWVEPTPEAFAEALANIAGKSEAVRMEMGRRGRLMVLERYSWGAVADAIVDECSRIVSDKGRVR